MTAKAQERDDKLLEMLANGSTVALCAVSLGCSPTTIYRRMADALFRVKLAAARANAWAPATERLRASVNGAIDTMIDLMANAQHESTRLRAAESVVRLAIDLRRLSDVDERVARLEALVEGSNDADNADAETSGQDA